MKLKLDENIGNLGRAILEAAGHDVATVSSQKLNGSSDFTLYGICQNEQRALVTLDRDFGETLRFPPEDTEGIVILAGRGLLSPGLIESRMKDLTVYLGKHPIDGELWIVEAGRLRVHERHKRQS